MKKVIYFLPVFVLISFIYFQSVSSQDGPNTWTQTYNNNGRVYAMVINPVAQTTIYWGGLDSGVYKTTNGGANWFPVNNGLTYIKVQALAIGTSNANVLYAGTDQLGTTNSGVYKTTDGGASWTLVNNGIVESSKGIQAIVVDPTNANIAYITVFDGVANSTNGLYKTTDGGTTWVPITTGLGANKNFLAIAINPLNPNVLYAGTSFQPPSTGPSKIYRTNNAGGTWIDVSNGLPSLTTNLLPVRDLSVSTVDTSVVLAGLFLNDTSGGAYLTTNGGQNWVKKHGLPNVAGTLLRTVKIRPGTSNQFFVGLDGGGATSRGVWRSTNGGATWADFNNGAMLNTYTVRALVFKTVGDTTIYAGAATATPTTGRGVFEYSWPAPVVSVNRTLLLPTPGVNTNYVMIPHQAGMIGFTNITIEGWVRIGGSTTANTVLNKGGSSFDYQLGINASTTNPFFRAITTIVIATTVTITPNVWTHLAVTYDGTTVRFYKNGSLAFSQTQSVTFGSSSNEMRIGRGGNDAGSGRLDEIRLWNVARTEPQLSADMCNKWIANSTTGLKGKWHFDSTYTDSVNNWNGTPLGNCGFDTVTWCPITGVQQTGSEVPARYVLEQNYPNPFNPATTFKFSLPKEGYVEIILYDITGREVATLVSDPFKAGTYTVTFDGTNLSSGVYFYRIVSGDFTDAKKMVLIK